MTKRLVWWDLKYADWSKPTDIQETFGSPDLLGEKFQKGNFRYSR